VLLIAASGLLLNNTDTFGLSARSAASPLFQKLYGMDPPSIQATYSANGLLFSAIDNTVYLEEQALLTETSDLRGAVATSDEIVIATRSEFAVLAPNGALVERIRSNPNTEVGRLGAAGNEVVADMGGELFVFDTVAMNLKKSDVREAQAVRWSTPIVPDADRQEAIQAAAMGRLLSWERILTDLHSGRLLPVAGRYIADITALCLIYLCITGLFLWFRRR